MKRRGFLDGLLALGFVSTAASVLYPIWRFVIPPANAEPATDSIVAGKVSEFKPNTGAVLKFGTKPAILIRTTDGDLTADSREVSLSRLKPGELPAELSAPTAEVAAR